MLDRKILAIIPARGGSKGIKRKNLVDICGKPLISYSIAHALQAKSIDKVIVSTEDEEIKRIALNNGADVPFTRPSELAEDDVLDYPVFEHALKYLDVTEGYKPEIIVHLRPTSPIRKIDWIEQAINLLINNPGADSVRSVSLVDSHPFRMFKIDSTGHLEPLMKNEHSQPYLLRRQDLPEIFYYNCVIDITRYKTIMNKKSMTGDRILPFIIDKELVFDIDSMRDLEITRLFINKIV